MPKVKTPLLLAGPFSKLRQILMYTRCSNLNLLYCFHGGEQTSVKHLHCFFFSFLHPSLINNKAPSVTSVLLSDLNECNKKTYYCDQSAFCTNTRGSYECTCSQGCVGDGFACYRYASKMFFVSHLFFGTTFVKWSLAFQFRDSGKHFPNRQVGFEIHRRLSLRLSIICLLLQYHICMF